MRAFGTLAVVVALPLVTALCAPAVRAVTPEEIEKGIEAFAPQHPKGERCDEATRTIQ